MHEIHEFFGDGETQSGASPMVTFIGWDLGEFLEDHFTR